MIPENTGPAAVIVLAAGAGTRMKSRTPKILHEIGGRSMVGHALPPPAASTPRRLALVVRHERDLVARTCTRWTRSPDRRPGRSPRHRPRRRSRTRGAGRPRKNCRGTVVVTYGDVPLLSGEPAGRPGGAHEREGNAVTVLTALLEDATGYGRILRGDDGTVTGIREHKDATDAER